MRLSPALLLTCAAACSSGSSALAADYVNVDATSFSSCPTAAPITPTAATSSNTVNTANSPNTVHTWYGTSHEWVFVSTAAGIQVWDYKSGSPVFEGTLGSTSNGFIGFDPIDQGVANQRLLVALRNDAHVKSFQISFSDPSNAIGTIGDLNLWNPSSAGTYACSGTNPSTIDPGSTFLVGNDSAPSLVYVTNECLNGTAGSVDVIDVSGTNPVLRQRVGVDVAPVGMALGPGDDVLYVTNEKAGAVTKSLMGVTTVGSQVGSLMVFEANTSAPYLVLKKAVNPGCTAVRVTTGSNRVWVSARSSHDVQVFDADKLLSDTVNSRIAVFRVGPQPTGIKIIDGNKILVANSDRSEVYHKPSLTVYRVASLMAELGWGDKGHTRIEPPPCYLISTANGTTGFPRNLAADSHRSYVSLASADKLQWVNLTTIQSACP